MFTNMRISRKIGVSFLAIVMTVAAMMAVIYWSVAQISSNARRSAIAQETYTATLTMEMAILRQNSQVRGFLITRDEDYLTQYGEARTDGIEAARDLIGLLADREDRAKVIASRDRMAAWRRTWGDALIAQTRAGDTAGAQARLRTSSKLVTVTPC